MLRATRILADTHEEGTDPCMDPSCDTVMDELVKESSMAYFVEDHEKVHHEHVCLSASF